MVSAVHLRTFSIGVASGNGKAYIHSAGQTENREEVWGKIAEQDAFWNPMAASAQAVANHFGDNILYINVMNNMSIDCDCNGHPANPKIKKIAVLRPPAPRFPSPAPVGLVGYRFSPEALTYAPCWAPFEISAASPRVCTAKHSQFTSFDFNKVEVEF